jgi:hypothetical protein
MPCNSLAVPQVPLIWPTTNASWAVPVEYRPSALQFPADAQDTDWTRAYPLVLRAAVAVAESGELTLEHEEHLIFTGVHVGMNRQRRRVAGLHHAELAGRVLACGLDHDNGTMKFVGRALTAPEHEPGHHRPPPSWNAA